MWAGVSEGRSPRVAPHTAPPLPSSLPSPAQEPLGRMEFCCSEGWTNWRILHSLGWGEEASRERGTRAAEPLPRLLPYQPTPWRDLKTAGCYGD